ncbi:MAG: PrsW family intramembrane metalloprotease [Flavobacteriaceae bacterium]|nr:PrsW family intramembrane metalloprotease [Flavobacteriaceae bacterium]
MNLLIAATTPIFIIIIYFYIKDKYEKESKRILGLTFLLGAVVSIIVTTVLYTFFDLFMPLPDDYSIWQQFVKAFFVVALIEEFSKYIVVRYFAQTRNGYNEPYDGIIYAVMVSMGFAAVENLMYVLQGGMEVALLRAVTAVPAHAMFAVIMGYFMGKAKFSNNRIKWNLIGLLGAILFHGSYDFFLFIGFIPGISIGAFISLIIGIILSKRAIKAHQNISHFKP